MFVHTCTQKLHEQKIWTTPKIKKNKYILCKNRQKQRNLDTYTIVHSKAISFNIIAHTRLYRWRQLQQMLYIIDTHDWWTRLIHQPASEKPFAGERDPETCTMSRCWSGGPCRSLLVPAVLYQNQRLPDFSLMFNYRQYRGSLFLIIDRLIVSLFSYYVIQVIHIRAWTRLIHCPLGRHQGFFNT